MPVASGMDAAIPACDADMPLTSKILGSQLEKPWLMAKENSESWAPRGRIEYSEFSFLQDIFRAVGYATGDRIANAALATWKLSLQYEKKFLDIAARYGAVGVGKSGDVYYITYFASTYH